tara:strand:+ start:1178 stop:2959 length:1782 start_codon:yes stop_codon:yes gene_type:complete
MNKPMSLEQIRSLQSSSKEQASVSENAPVPTLTEIRERAPRPLKPSNDLASEDKGVDESLPELLGRGLLFGVERAGAGMQELARAGITDLTGIDVLTDFKNMRIEREKDFSTYTGRMNDLEHRVFWLGGYTGQVASFAAAPSRTLGQVVATSMVASASLPTEQGDAHLLSQERTMNALIGSFGGILPQALINTGKTIVGKSVIDPLKNITSFFSRKGGEKEALKGVNAIATKEATDAANRLGVKITPAEASANPVILSREARALGGLDSATALKAGELHANRNAELANTVEGFVEGILPEGKKAAKLTLDTLYKKAFTVKMNPNLVARMEKNEIYASAQKSLLTDPAEKAMFESLEQGSLGQVELIRRKISTDAHNAAISIDGIQRGKSKALKSVNSLIKNALTKSSDEYAMALPIAQRQIAQKRILDALGKVKTKGSEAGTSVYNATPDQFYDAILSTPQQRSELARQLKEVGGSSQAIDDLAFVLARLKDTPFKALNVSRDKAFGMATGGFGKTGVAVHNITAFLRGRHNLAMVELITNGKWQNALAKVRSIKDPAKQLNALSTSLAYVTTDNIDELKKQLINELPSKGAR